MLWTCSVSLRMSTDGLMERLLNQDRKRADHDRRGASWWGGAALGWWPHRTASREGTGVVVSIVVSIQSGRVRHCEMLPRQIARAVNELAFPCRTFLCASIA